MREVERDVITNVLSHTTDLHVIEPLVGMKVANNTQTLSHVMLLYHDEGDFERRKEGEVGVKERHGIGDLHDSFVLRADSTDEDSVDRRRLVAKGVEDEFNVGVL